MSNARTLASFLSSTPTADFNFDSNSLVVDISENTVGIGDTTPDGKLEVRQTASADILNLYDDTTNVLTVVDGGNVGIGDDSPDGKLEVRQSGTDDIFNLYDDTTNVLTVVDGGKVGIGTSTPDGLVDIRQSGTDDILNLYDGTDNIFTVIDGGKVGIKSSTPDGMLDVRSLTADDIFNLYDGSTNVFTVVDGGDVGIGTSTPSSSADTNLHVKGSSTASIHIEDDEKRWEHLVNGYYLIREVGSSTNTRFFIEEDTGNIGIGTTSPDTQVEVYNSSSAYTSVIQTGAAGVSGENREFGAIHFKNNHTNASGAKGVIEAFRQDSDTNVALRFNTHDSGSEHTRFIIGATGNITPGGDNVGKLGANDLRFVSVHAVNGTIQTSDRNEKKEIEENKLGLDFINALKTKSYKFKENNIGGTHYGLLAQDIEDVLDQFNIKVNEYAPVVKDKIIDKNNNERFRYGLTYTEFIAPLIKSVQELSAKNDALSAEIASLKNTGENA